MRSATAVTSGEVATWDDASAATTISSATARSAPRTAATRSGGSPVIQQTESEAISRHLHLTDATTLRSVETEAELHQSLSMDRADHSGYSATGPAGGVNVVG